MIESISGNIQVSTFQVVMFAFVFRCGWEILGGIVELSTWIICKIFKIDPDVDQIQIKVEAATDETKGS
jgi:uncharacterized membrane protein YciS (DUF1049 family)